MPITLVLADDHPIILDGLENLCEQEKDLKVLARCLNGEEALQAVRKHRPDVLILDIRMPRRDGLDVLRQIREEKLPTRVILLAAAVSEDEMVEALTQGVGGVVLKEMAPQLLLHCIRKVHAGEQWLETRSTGRALEKIIQREVAKREVADQLSARELEIVRMVVEGLRNKEIARQLSVTEGTVKIHLHNIYGKLNVDSRLGLILYAQGKGLV